jgi:CRP/FNR family transcriptional regulator, cyclic AMP receptor protein
MKAGNKPFLAIVGPGDFGGAGCLAGQPVSWATATATAPTTVLAIEENETIRALQDEHEFSDRFIAYMLSRNIRMEEDLADQPFNSSEKRLARALLLARYGPRGEPQKMIAREYRKTCWRKRSEKAGPRSTFSRTNSENYVSSVTKTARSMSTIPA